MGTQDIEEACVLATATSPDNMIVMGEIPEYSLDARVPVQIFQIGSKLSKTSSSDPSKGTLVEECERWSSLQKLVAFLLCCGILLFIVLATYFLYQVLPIETFVQVFCAVYVVLFVAIFLCTIFVKKCIKCRKGAAVDIDEMLQQLDRDRL